MTEDRILRKRLSTAIVLVIAIFFIGVIGYRVIEKWSLLDSVYMTVITLTTVGFSEAHPLSNGGRIFTIGLILSGLSIMGYGFSIIATFIVDGELARVISRRKMNKDIEKLKNHYIICGAGELGRCVVEEFVKTRTAFVVIENDKSNLAEVRQYDGICYIDGDATKDATLLAAGIARAQGLVSALHNDKDNLFVVLTARALNSRLRIVSRVVEPESEHKLITAGANSVVSPKFIGGMRMASIMIRPAVVSFLDIMLRNESLTLRLEEVRLPKQGNIVGRTLREADIARHTGLIVIAIKRLDEDNYIYNPKPDIVLQANDTLIVMGETDQVRKLRKLAGAETVALLS